MKSVLSAWTERIAPGGTSRTARNNLALGCGAMPTDLEHYIHLAPLITGSIAMNAGRRDTEHLKSF